MRVVKYVHETELHVYTCTCNIHTPGHSSAADEAWYTCMYWVKRVMSDWLTSIGLGAVRSLGSSGSLIFSHMYVYVCSSPVIKLISITVPSLLSFLWLRIVGM